MQTSNQINHNFNSDEITNSNKKILILVISFDFSNRAETMHSIQLYRMIFQRQSEGKLKCAIKPKNSQSTVEQEP